MPLTISAVIAAGVHLFPFRTEKLSPPAPMVLGGQPPGRVGRRRITLTKAGQKPAFVVLRPRAISRARQGRARATAAPALPQAGAAPRALQNPPLRRGCCG